jgi:ParB-like chromosome segregation protein Spo0J
VSGYGTSRLAIAQLKPTEEVDAAHVRAVAADMERDGVQRCPILVERQTMAILDGHHRFRAAQMLGLAAINAVLIGYDDPRLTLASWREVSYSRDDVLRAAASGALLPAKSTRHILNPAVQDMPVPLGDLSRAPGGGRPIP